MKNSTTLSDHISSNSNPTTGEGVTAPEKKSLDRRSFLKNSVIAGAAVTAGAAVLGNASSALAEPNNGHLTRGDAAILRWLAAAEIIESDLWLQYTELAGTQDNEVSTIASQQIPDIPQALQAAARYIPPLFHSLTATWRNTFTTTRKMN